MTARMILSRTSWRDLIRPVLPHAGADGTLPIINAVHLSCDGTTVVAVATDRYTLGFCRHVLAEDNDEKAEPFTALVSLADIKASLVHFKPQKWPNTPLRFEITAERAVISDALDEPDLTMRARLIDGEFPKVTKLILDYAGSEAKTLDGPVGLNPHYLARFASATRHNEALRLVACGDRHRPLVVAAGDHFIGCHMPVRVDDDALPIDVGSWRETLTPAPKAAPKSRRKSA